MRAGARTARIESLEPRLVLSAAEETGIGSATDDGAVHPRQTSCNCPGCAMPLPDPLIESATTQSSAFAPFPLEDTFTLHSRPEATKVIYLDFDGQTVSGTPWNTLRGVDPIVQTGYDTDGDTNTFSDNELAQIQDIWLRVVEDFIPFDVNVTTEEPNIEDLRNTGGADTRWGIRVIIGGSSSPVAPDTGGVAYLGSFSDSIDNPCWVFQMSPSAVAEAISHEVGHTLGLSHDGTSTQGYYTGHGFGPTGYAPIMGVGYYRDLVVWSSGEYADANNQQDDLAIITGEQTTRWTPAGNGFTYIADDYSDDLDTAHLLDGSDVQGVIQQNTDIDIFTFFTTGSIDIDILPAPVSPNLDILATLLDATGTVIATSNPIDALHASFNTLVDAGWYYLTIDGTGKGNPLGTGYTDYGSLGQYTLSAVVSPPPPEVAFSEVLPNPRYAGEGVSSLDVLFQSEVSGFDLGDIEITRSGMPVDLSNATLTTTDNTTWALEGLFEATAPVGEYTATIRAAGSGIVSVDDGIAIIDDAMVSWSVVVPPPFEMNDSMATAHAIDLQNGTATLNAAIGDNRYLRDDVDLFAVDLSPAGTLTADVDAQSLYSQSRLDSYVRVFDANGREVARNDDHGASQDSYVSLYSAAGGRYYVGVSAYGNHTYNPAFGASGQAGYSAGSYTLQLSWLADDAPDEPDPPGTPDTPPGVAAEPNDSMTLATPLEFNNSAASVEGTIGDGDYMMADVDLYFFQLAAGTVVTADIDAEELSSPSRLDSYLRLFDANGQEIRANDDFGGSLDSRLTANVPHEGTYYIGVSAFGNSQYRPNAAGSGQPARSGGSYLLSVSVSTAPLPPTTPPQPPSPPPPSDLGEPSESIESSIPLVFENDAVSVQGFIGNGLFGLADVDVYALQLVAGTNIVVDINARSLPSPTGLDSYLRLFDRTGRLITANDDDDGSRDSLLVFSVVESGIYYIGVSAYGNYLYDVARAGSGRAAETSGGYELSVSQAARESAFSLLGPSRPNGGGSSAIPLLR